MSTIERAANRVQTVTRRWLEDMVVGHQLCPFAAPVIKQQTLVIEVSQASHELAVLQDLEQAITSLLDASSTQLETSLLVVPDALASFDDFNQFLDQAEALLEVMHAEQRLQLASFHPEYCFADADQSDAANFTNRSPYPMLHLLRVDSVARAIDGHGDAERITQRNIELMEKIGTPSLVAQLAKLSE